jgi:hypothetical protein
VRPRYERSRYAASRAASTAPPPCLALRVYLHLDDDQYQSESELVSFEGSDQIAVNISFKGCLYIPARRCNPERYVNRQLFRHPAIVAFRNSEVAALVNGPTTRLSTEDRRGPPALRGTVRSLWAQSALRYWASQHVTAPRSNGPRRRAVARWRLKKFRS